ncbi:Uncharacterised protein [Yersinia aldovae]|nr:Uncharacterised protein [Yersinia aldovae]
MGRIGNRTAALLDGGQHRLRAGSDGGAVDHQIQIVGISGHIISVNQFQHNVAAILIEDRQVRCYNRITVIPATRASYADRAAVQCQISHRHHAAGLRLRCRTVKDQGAAAQIQPVQGTIGGANRGHVIRRQFQRGIRQRCAVDGI